MATPISYPGSKIKAPQNIVERIQIKGHKTIVSPFIGGGSVEVYAARSGIKVIAFDKFEPLVDFWQTLLYDAETLVDCLKSLMRKNEIQTDRDNYTYPIPKEHIAFFRQSGEKALTAATKTERAAWFYIKNKSSYGDKMFARCKLQPYDKTIYICKDNPNISKQMIESLIQYQLPNLTVEHADFRTVFKTQPKEAMFYCDPPYYGNEEHELYGINGHLHKGFPHDILCNLLQETPYWLLSYNNIPEIWKMYQDYTIHELDWAYRIGRTKKEKKPKELLIEP